MWLRWVNQNARRKLPPASKPVLFCSGVNENFAFRAIISPVVLYARHCELGGEPQQIRIPALIALNVLAEVLDRSRCVK